MKTILELEITQEQEALLIDMLKEMNITFSKNRSDEEFPFQKVGKKVELLRNLQEDMNTIFSDNHVEEEAAFEKGGTAVEIKKAVNDIFGIWKDRTEWKDFGDFRRQAWGGRGVK